MADGLDGPEITVPAQQAESELRQAVESKKISERSAVLDRLQILYEEKSKLENQVALDQRDIAKKLEDLLTERIGSDMLGVDSNRDQTGRYKKPIFAFSGQNAEGKSADFAVEVDLGDRYSRLVVIRELGADQGQDKITYIQYDPHTLDLPDEEYLRYDNKEGNGFMAYTENPRMNKEYVKKLAESFVGRDETREGQQRVSVFRAHPGVNLFGRAQGLMGQLAKAKLEGKYNSTGQIESLPAPTTAQSVTRQS